MSTADGVGGGTAGRPPAAGRAQWRWEFVGRLEQVLDKPVSPVFTSRFDAEAWLGEHWRGLAADRVLRAVLYVGPAQVGQPVELREA
ncbi:MAG TPA: hypothetical protein PKB06_12430 [Actinotalea sp.]|nr:hypothetical protein [Actinotalea sp.]